MYSILRWLSSIYLNIIDMILTKTYKIPQGLYCYDENGLCRYWGIKKPEEPGFPSGSLAARCNLLNIDGPDMLLDDQCKICGINEGKDA